MNQKKILSIEAKKFSDGKLAYSIIESQGLQNSISPSAAVNLTNIGNVYTLESDDILWQAVGSEFKESNEYLRDGIFFRWIQY